MSKEEADIKTDIKAAGDRAETIGLMEPMLLSETSRHRPELMDMAIALAARSAGFRSSLPPSIFFALADMVRAMNCYYSNLIEGHDTHPVDIEKALKNDYSADTKKRNLQLEARAHITTQQWIDQQGLKNSACTIESICEIHRRFCEQLPDDLLWIPNLDTGENYRMTPGVLRQHDVKVGKHIAISPGAVPRFMRRFEDAYAPLGRSERILAAAAAHHRLAWIHPFMDGNGRVARLMSHAMLLDALDTGSVWSVARGLARNVADYKSHLANCDLPRRNDLDGRGSLSEEALADFTKFFLEVCRDQVAFMESLVQPDRLRTRIMIWAEEEIRMDNLPAKAGQVLDALLYRGELSRSEVPDILGTGDRQARRMTSALIDMGVLVSDSSRSPLRLAFPAALAHRWMPGLFPEQTLTDK